MARKLFFFNKNWIDPDANAKGIRVGFVSDDGVFSTASWSEYKDRYFHRQSDEDNASFEDSKAIDQVPTHWAAIKIEL